MSRSTVLPEPTLSLQDRLILSRFLRGYSESAIAEDLELTEDDVRIRIEFLLKAIERRQ